MKIDITALRALEREKDISFDLVCQAIETALLTAYRHTDHHSPKARVEVNRKSGEIRVLARESLPTGEDGPEWDDTPQDFGRIAATTACTRLPAPTFLIAAFRWNCTVCSDTDRIWPIDQALLPRAVQVRHSRSRSLSCTGG